MADLFLYGAFGALLPEIVLFWSKRYTAPLLAFNLWQYAVVAIAYAAAAGVVATIYPYPGTPTPWHAVAVGAGLPTIVSGLVAVGNRMSRSSTERLTLRGPKPVPGAENKVRIPGTLIDLFSVY